MPLTVRKNSATLVGIDDAELGERHTGGVRRNAANLEGLAFGERQ